MKAVFITLGTFFLCILVIGVFLAVHFIHFPPAMVALRVEGPVGPPELKDITGIAWSHDGHTLATVDDNKTISLWDAARGTNLRELQSGGNEWLSSPAFSPDGYQLVTVDSSQGFNSTEGHLLFWDPATGERLGSVDHLEWPKCTAFNPAGTLVVVGGTPALYLIDPSTREITHQVERAHENGAIQAVAFNPSGDLLVTAGRDGTVKLWQVPELNLVRTLQIGQSAKPYSATEGTVRVIVGSVAFAHSTPLVAASTTEGAVIVWDANDGQEIARHSYDYSTAKGDDYIQATLGNSLSFTSDDRWLLTTNRHGNGVRLVEAQRKKETGDLFSNQSNSALEAVDVSPADGSVAVAYRIFTPGQNARTKFEIWKVRMR